MKLIFKIFKKVRKLKKDKRKLRDRINLLVIEKIDLQSDIEKLGNYIDRRYAMQIKRETQLIEREKELDEREKELNSLHVKLNDQILKLGIVNGVNK